MHCRLIFGWHLDGGAFPETADCRVFTAGTQICGPSGFADFMETRFGLGYPHVSQAVRTAQYLAKLRSLDNGQLFFSRSLETDAWSTALYLLRKRDELIAAGWRPDIRDENERLGIMSAIELSAGGALSPGFADRIAELSSYLARACSPVLDSVSLATPLHLLPPAWVKIFTLIAEQGVAVEEIPSVPAATPGDLARVQRALAGQTMEQLKGDGSFVVIESDDELQAASVVAALFAATTGCNGDLVIIRGPGTSLLDECCHSLGLPRPGGGITSRWRATLQVLPLAFELLWNPVDPSRLLEFLSLPQSPIPRSVAYFFKEALREHPGVGGPAWQSAWERSLEKWRERLTADGLPVDRMEKQLARDIKEWRDWLEPQRFDPTEGVPTSIAGQLCQKVQQWAGARIAPGAAALFADLIEHCSALAQALSESGLPRISRVQVQRMLDAVFGFGSRLPGGGAEAADWTPVDHPGQIWGPAQKILWFGFVSNAESVPIVLWTNTELEHLRQQGVEIEHPRRRLLREASSWRTAVNNAVQQLVLVRPRTLNGEVAASHPFWHELQAVLAAAGHTAGQRTSYQAHDFLSVSRKEFAGRELSAVAVQERSPPAGRRYWNFGKSRPPLPEKESYTSISRMLACPLSWLLGQSIKLKTGVLLDLPDRERLAGNLAHLVIATLFSERDHWEESAAAARAVAIFDRAVPAIAAPLLLPGRNLELARYRTAIERAARALARYLNMAGLIVTACETTRSMGFQNRTLESTLDLLCADSHGRLIVIDLKWTRSTEYRRREIQEGRPVQLAIYSSLVREESTGEPQAGYFMLTDARLFFTAPEPFPPYTYVEGTNLPQVWSNVASSYKFHMEQLNRGIAIATGVSDAEQWETERKQGHQEGLLDLQPPCHLCEFRRICAVEDKES